MPTLRELLERRAWECRLMPERALESLDEAEGFLRDRGLFTRTPDSALPSLFAACHEEPYAPGSPGFGSWPATKYRWSFELLERPGVYALRIHRGKHLYLTEETVALADPICRAELARMEAADPRWARLLQHLADAGASLLGDLDEELGLKGKELKALRSPLERCGALVGREVVLQTAAGGHVHTTELARWDQAFPEPAAGPGGIEELTVAGVRAAVAAPEREVPRWFSWPWLVPGDLVERLVAEGRLVRPESGYVAIA